jgi:uncharacterized membrane protein required for colicin V production
MLNLDLLLLVLLLLCFVYGMLRGFLRMLVSLAALIVAALAVWLLNALVGYLYIPGFLSASMSGALIGTALFVLVYVVVLAIGRRLIKTRALAFSKGTADRLIGGIFSLCIDAAILLLLIWFLDCIGEDSFKRNERLRILWSESRVCQLAHEHNPLNGFGPLRRLKGFLVAARDPDTRSKLRDQAAYNRLFENPRLQAIGTDDELIDALRRGDWIGVFGNNRVRTLLSDESFWRDLFAVKWESTLGDAKIPLRVRLSPTPKPYSMPPELPPERQVEVGASSLAKVVLKRGTVLRGVITREDANGITLNILMNGGAISMDIGKGEIERIERTDLRRAPHDTTSE